MSGNDQKMNHRGKSGTPIPNVLRTEKKVFHLNESTHYLCKVDAIKIPRMHFFRQINELTFTF